MGRLWVRAMFSRILGERVFVSAISALCIVAAKDLEKPSYLCWFEMLTSGKPKAYRIQHPRKTI
jgi:hypothetical protein